MVGNIVPPKVDAHQNNWPMAKILSVCPDKNGIYCSKCPVIC